MKNYTKLFKTYVFYFLTVNTVFSQNNSLQFDGVNDYVNINAIASDLSTTSNFTIEFWMKAGTNQNVARVPLFAINRAAPGDNEFLILMGGTGSTQTGNLIIYDQYTTGTNYEIVSSQVIGDGECHHIAYVRTGNTGEAFIDGVSVGTHNAGYSFVSTHRYSLGQEWDNTTPSDFYKGNMDEIRIWSVARTQTQIQSNMNNSLSGSETGLLTYYNCNQGISGANNSGINSVTDLTTNTNNGNLINFALTGSSSNWINSSCSEKGYNNSLQFDGVNDYVNINAIASDLSAVSNFTVEFWMKADTNQNIARVPLFAVNPAAPGDNEFLILMGGTGSTQTGNLIIYDQYTTGTNYEIVSSQVIGDGECHHIAYVKTGNRGEAFIDGVSVGIHDAGYSFVSTHRYSLGQEWDNTTPSDFYKGNMDEIRIWSVARTQTQIQSNMNNSLSGSETGLLTYYNCNQGISGANNSGINFLTDLTVNTNNGNLINFALNGLNSNWVIEPCEIIDYGNLKVAASLQDFNDDVIARVYPNPTTGWTNIDGLNNNSDVVIYNGMGQLVMTIIANNDQFIRFNANELENGIYFVFERSKDKEAFILIDKLLVHK